MVKGKRRVRWRRLATILIMAYLAYWSAVSVGHLWNLWLTQRSLQARIARVSQQNQLLTREVQAFRRPATVRSLISGEKPLPSLTVTP
jgi:cell division protein FtsB